ncbi:hypothetical protein D9619_010829 [Psilocybe cf. subviscida]|uniref:Uncharacterized protein n=1 Tax=Psilocybe cf. subviscida TaxID=2480587 RepID=A0A8H5B8H8_9AGAR|nr:hypothetical protein D9619_010829 [Psilocybe cf. subviscida]
MPTFDRSVSSGSLASSATLSEFSDSDWDRSTSDLPSLLRPTTPLRQSSSSSSSSFYEPSSQSSSIIFPAPASSSIDPANEHTPRRRAVTDVQHSMAAMTIDDRTEANAEMNTESEFTQTQADSRKNGKRTLSDLLCRRVGSASEAHRIADVLGQWINASSSPYEPDMDDFFAPGPLSPSPYSPSAPSSAPRTPALSLASRSTPHTPSSASSAAFDFRMSTAPGRRGSITNRGGVTVVAPALVSPGVIPPAMVQASARSGDVSSSSGGGAQPRVESRSPAVGRA